MTIYKNLHWIVCFIFLLSCARQSSPTGGPKDTIPPILVRAIPSNEAINFKASKIELQFSEDVVLNAPKEQLIVTPAIGKEYKITSRKNSIVIELDEPLRDSTTYTFNFRESVADITEKNPARNLQLAYSTGTYIDSLSIEGKIFNLLTGTDVKDATVALYVQNDTFNIFEHPAEYFTRTDEKGRFKISHLKPDNYTIYAFEDKNRNLIVNSRSESYGFLSEPQYLLENIKDVAIGLIRLDAGPLKLTSARPYNTYFNIRASKNLRTFQITATDSSEVSYTFGEDPSNIRMYKTTDQDSLKIRLTAFDSIDNAIDTTLYAKFLSREVTPEDFDINVTSSSILAHTGQLLVTLNLSKPLDSINYDSIYFQVDSLTRVNFSKNDFKWEPLKKQLTISKILNKSLFQTDEVPNGQARRGMRITAPAPDQAKDKKKTVLNELNLRTAAFVSVEEDSSESITQAIKPLTPAELAIINIEIQTTENSFLVELLDNDDKILKQVANRRRVKFEDVVPGEYQVRLIIDKNKNGRWDPGNYFKDTEPEPVIYYRAPDGTTTIKGVKANWEIGTDGEMLITY